MSASKLHWDQVHDLLLSNAERLFDEDYLAEFLAPHCTTKVAGMRGSRLRIIQVPREFARFLVFMGRQKVNSYVELGTSTGGSWYMTDSYLRAVNPSFRRSVGCDRKLKLRDWDAYQRRFPGIEFRHQNTRDLALAERFDLAFIDATHKSHWVEHDFNKVKDWCKFVAFHDIVLPKGTVGDFWRVVKREYPSWEFIDSNLPATCGIGVVRVSD